MLTCGTSGWGAGLRLRLTTLGLILTAAACDSRDDPRLPPDIASRYEYARATPLVLEVLGRTLRDSVAILDVRYQSPIAGHVPAYLIRPVSGRQLPLLVYGHWLMDGSPLRSRAEFLEEAVLIARAGALVLLPDAPQVRLGFVADARPMESMSQSAHASRQMVIDVRRAIDHLIESRDADRSRIAYVGHSFGAHVGAILAAVDKRVGSLVLMAGGFADEEYVFDDSLPDVRAFRAQIGDSALREFYRATAWDDPVHFIRHSAPAAFYAAGHELDAAARADLVTWLATRLKLSAVDTAAISRIPQLR